jgi:hypothetical protein
MRSTTRLFAFWIALTVAATGCCGVSGRSTERFHLTAEGLERDLAGRFASTGRSTWEFEVEEERRLRIVDSRRVGSAFVAYVDVETATVDGKQTASGRLRLTYEWVGGTAHAWNLVRIESLTFRRTDGGSRGCCGG